RVLPIPELLARGAQPGFAKIPLETGSARRLPSEPDALAKVALRALLQQSVDAPKDALIQYFGPRNTYPTVSYYQASDWQTYLPGNPFKDKLVFVGFGQDAQADVASGSADAFPTSYTTRGAGLTFGSEIHATILDNLRYGLWIDPLPLPVIILLALAI